MTRSVLLGDLVVLATAGNGTAQDVVPGGWDMRVGFQSFGRPADGSAYDSFGYRNPIIAGYADFRLESPTATLNLPAAPWFSLDSRTGTSQTFDGLIPLAGTVRRQVRRRPSR